MNNYLIALLIGIGAGTIDVVPMVIKKLSWSACISAFVHYLVLGLIIPFVQWELEPWFKGLLIAELSALPIMIIVFRDDKKAIVPMLILSAILGAAIGVSGTYFISY